MNGGFFEIKNNVLKKVKGSDRNVVIPDSVIKIGKDAFNWNEKIQSVTIPDSVTEIEEWAFHGCSSLKSIAIPDSVTEIGSFVFSNCGKLQNVTIPDSVTKIGSWAFSGCIKMKSITIPKNVKEIGDDAFRGCSSLKSVDMLSDLSLTVNAVAGVPMGAWKDLSRLLPQMTDGLLKKYLLKDDEWKNLSLTHQLELVLRPHTKVLDPVFLQVISNPEEIAEKMIGMLEGKIPAKTCSSIVSFMILFSENISVDLFRQLYDRLSSVKSSGSALKRLEKDPFAASIVMSEDALAHMQEKRLPVERKTDRILNALGSSSKQIEVLCKKMFSDISLPDITDREGNVVDPTVFRYLLTVYNRNKIISDYIEDNESVLQSSASEILEMLDPAVFQRALASLAQNNLGKYVNGKKKNLSYPICHYAEEPLMAKLTAKAPSWRTYTSGDDAACLKTFRDACLYSDTRSAILLTDRYHDLHKYAGMRNEEEDTIRDRVLGDVGLDHDGRKVYDLGSQKVTVMMKEDFTFAVINEKGKVMKSIPKKNSDPEKYEKAHTDFAEISKSVKKIIKNRKAILFEKFLDGTEKSAKNWKQVYLDNPVLRTVAATVIWQQENTFFIVKGDHLITVDDQEYIFNDSPVRVAHPIDMSREEIRAWQKHMTSAGLKQPFAQIWEPVIDPETVKADRYKGCRIPYYRFEGQKKHGITVDDWDFHNEITIEFDQCDAVVDRLEPQRHALLREEPFEIVEFKPWDFNRRINHLIGYLDMAVVRDKVMNDDVSVINILDNFTLAQIREFITLASQYNSVNVAALLLNYQNEHFDDLDPMDEFTLEDL